MHFLCLHGKGTNSKIFELQTAALRYTLGDEHTYDFVEGSIPCDPAPGVNPFSSPNDESFAYFDETSPPNCRETLDDLDAYITSSGSGPFDGVMAFSMGATLAATLMVRKAQQHADPPFRLAVFFCGGVPGDAAALDRDESRLLEYAVDGEVICVPTAHIWGKNDPRNPAWGPVLSQLCNSQVRSTFVHRGGHEIPGWNDKTGLEKTVKCIQKAIDRALSFH